MLPSDGLTRPWFQKAPHNVKRTDHIWMSRCPSGTAASRGAMILAELPVRQGLRKSYEQGELDEEAATNKPLEHRGLVRRRTPHQGARAERDDPGHGVGRRAAVGPGGA